MLALLIEDDIEAATSIRSGLETRGHSIDVAADGRSGLALAGARAFDVLIIDRMLPGLDGLSLVRALRTTGVKTPAIFLTALGGVTDRVDGLQAGGDDYLVKPFDLDELEARMEALSRRPPLPDVTVLTGGAFSLDRLRRRARVAGRALALTHSELAMLELLMMNAGRPVTKRMLLEHVFDLDSATPGVVVEPHVSRLRGKITLAGVPDPIRTLRGRGYSFHAD